MATRTPPLQTRSQFGRDWGNYATAADLPNASGAPLGAPFFSILEVGDTAYSVADGATYTCTNVGTAGGGDAVWSSGGGGGGGTNASYLTGATNEESLTGGGTEVVVGGFVYSPAHAHGMGHATRFRAFETLVYTSGSSPTARVRLYDRGAPGAPTAGTLVAELTNSGNVNVPYTQLSAAFATDPTTPSLGVIVDAVRMYEIRVLFTDADSLLVRWAGLEIR